MKRCRWCKTIVTCDHYCHDARRIVYYDEDELDLLPYHPLEEICDTVINVKEKIKMMDSSSEEITFGERKKINE